jgi:GTP cyclohydrolase I
MDLDKIAAGFRQVMEGLGLNLDDPHLKDSARRTAEAWYEEICRGLREPAYSLQVYPVEEGLRTGIIALQDIPVKSLCAHHLLPFVGRATVAYLPGPYICGLSNLSRVVDHFARRPQLQEHLTHQIAESLENSLSPRGVGVIVEASHFCMELRGVNHAGRMTTSVLTGALQDDPAARAEFLALAQQPPEK